MTVTKSQSETHVKDATALCKSNISRITRRREVLIEKINTYDGNEQNHRRERDKLLVEFNSWNAHLQEFNDHYSTGYYNLCMHTEDEHEASKVEPIEITDGGYTCLPAEYLVCSHCCMDGKEETCDNNHIHGEDEYYCRNSVLHAMRVLGVAS